MEFIIETLFSPHMAGRATGLIARLLSLGYAESSISLKTRLAAILCEISNMTVVCLSHHRSPNFHLDPRSAM